MPFPWKENEPTLPALSEALKSNREDVVFAVVLAALATGSSARASPPAQPTSDDVQAARQRKERTRRRVIRDSNRPRPGARLSLERGELGAPALGVLPQSRRLVRGFRLPQPLRRLRQRRDGAC